MASERRRDFMEMYAEWRRRRSEGRPSTSLERSLRRAYREAWDSADQKGRLSVLLFLGNATPRGGDSVAWDVIRSGSREHLDASLAVVLRYISVRKRRPDPDGVSALIRIATDDPETSIRFMALHVLTLAEVGGLDTWLRNLARRDPSSSIRKEANLALVRQGDIRAKEALFAYLESHPDHFGVAMDLWDRRHTANLTEDEDRTLRQLLLRYAETAGTRPRAPSP